MYRIGIIGLGYTGLPAALAFAKKYSVVGFDIDGQRIAQLQDSFDRNLEFSKEQLKASAAVFSSSIAALADCNVYIISVPTPADHSNCPDLTFLIKASEMVGELLAPGDLLIYEATVYPGVTEDICLPILESRSGLKVDEDFLLGYGPERINPGDPHHQFNNVIKVVAGHSAAALDAIERLYSSVIEAGVFRASSIKVAETAKVFENTQRDLNIALMNELAQICDKIGIDTADVLSAARTKWNFLDFTPGLVGGHCIGVDPYYLTHKATELGHHPKVILAGREINDQMAKFIAQKCITKLAERGISAIGATINILGATFKENCTDLRNSKVYDLVSELKLFGAKVKVIDPVCDQDSLEKIYPCQRSSLGDAKKAQALILTVPHSCFTNLELNHLVIDGGIIIDIKSQLKKELMLEKNYHYWRL